MDLADICCDQVYETILYEIVLGTILGALIGYAARKVIRFSERHKLVDRESFVAQYVSLALLSMGVNVLLGSDDLLAAFACGSAFAWDGWFTRQTEDLKEGRERLRLENEGLNNVVARKERLLQEVRRSLVGVFRCASLRGLGLVGRCSNAHGRRRRR